MKKQVLAVLAGLVGGAVFATDVSDRDSYLYWAIDPEAQIQNFDGSKQEIKDSYSVRIGAVDSSGITSYLNLYGDATDSGPILSGDGQAAGIGAFDLKGGGMFAGVGGYSSSSFFIEILNDSGNIIGHSETYAYAALAQYISSMKGAALPAAGAWMPAAYVAPEPSSGLLLLFGLAGLALRRRKQAVA